MVSTIAGRAAALDRRASPAVIGGARVLAGLLWLANLHWKVPPAFGEDTGGGLYKYSESVTRHSPFAPFTWVTEEIVLPNFRAFGWLTLISELLLAALLLVGYRTKIVALVGALWTVPILLSTIYYDGADEWSWAYFMMIGLHLVLYATDAGRYGGLDGMLGRGRRQARRGLAVLGGVGAVVGLAGLFVARSVGFAGDEVALLGSDAGFVTGDGVTRRWELKLLWFNPLWALLTVALSGLLIAGVRQRWAAWVGAVGFAAIAVVVFALQTFDYPRDDGVIQVVSTASNAAVWGALALGGLLLGRRASGPEGAVPAE